MKTLRSMLAVIALLVAGTAANAHVKTIGGNATTDDAINTYISAITSGKTSNLDKELDDNMKFSVHRGDNVNSINKDELLDNLKDTGASQPLSTKTTSLQDDDGIAKIKVEFIYDGFMRTDVVTLNKSTGWMITNVDSTTK